MQQWDGKSKAPRWGYLFFIRTIQLFGVKPAYFILQFVVPVYAVLFKEQRKNLLDFYRKGPQLDEKTARKTVRKNFYVFGQSLIDRVAFLVGKKRVFDFTMQGEEHILGMLEQGNGGFLISAHLGNWETAGNMLKDKITSTINIMMYDEEVHAVKEMLKQHTGGPLYNIIPIRQDLSHLFLVNKALKNNELICFHADRYLENARTIELPFFGVPTRFPQGPFEIAQKLQAPVCFVFGVKETKFTYALSSTAPLQTADAKELAHAFVETLEEKVLAYPEQWYNYYNFYA